MFTSAHLGYRHRVAELRNQKTAPCGAISVDDLQYVEVTAALLQLLLQALHASSL